MIPTPHVNWFSLAPELMMIGAAGCALLAAVLLPPANRRPYAALMTALGFAGAFVYAVVIYLHSPTAHGVLGDAIRLDRFGAFAQILVAGSGFLTVGVAYAQRLREEYVAEFYALLASAGAGMAFLVTANNLITLFLGLEWFSISLYILCAIDYELEGSLEAGLKYLIVGSFGSAFLLFGSALVYGTTGEIAFEQIGHAIGAQHLTHDPLLVVGLAMLLVGLGFKASAAPFHMWTPDVYEGASTAVTAFMSAATKVAALVLSLRVLRTAFPQEAHLWTVAVAAMAVASLAIGNLAALVQTNLKRLLAYSSISHAGFMLIAVAANSALGTRGLLYYLVPYTAMSLGSFAVVAARERELNAPVTLANLAGLGWERPLLGWSLAAFMFGFIGFPVSGTFLGKFYVLAAAYDHGWAWLVIVGVLATALSTYYYLAVIRAILRPAAELQLLPSGGSPPAERLLQASVAACLFVSLASLVAAQPIIAAAKHAARSLPL